MGFGFPVDTDLVMKLLIAIGVCIILPPLVAAILFGRIVRVGNAAFKILVSLATVVGGIMFFLYGLQRVFS
ncbi:hypothetical protein MLD56_16355 [Paenibacillus peoriae]|uniref:hypothetical protein n=1 Tax=Paenibacillus peoriae TaxID=59893 RepID=UPI001F132521|nr:hypothetical protein [Paenibacillus peoriae]UMY53146.1 hypothetical protein MLD56_16355 [Paenibacillus peoriae]